MSKSLKAWKETELQKLKKPPCKAEKPGHACLPCVESESRMLPKVWVEGVSFIPMSLRVSRSKFKGVSTRHPEVRVCILSELGTKVWE